jgi:hypothetical protein
MLYERGLLRFYYKLHRLASSSVHILDLERHHPVSVLAYGVEIFLHRSTHEFSRDIGYRPLHKLNSVENRTLGKRDYFCTTRTTRILNNNGLLFLHSTKDCTNKCILLQCQVFGMIDGRLDTSPITITSAHRSIQRLLPFNAPQSAHLKPLS